MQADDFWDDQESAQKVIAECKALKLWTDPYQNLNQSFSSIQALLPDVIAENELELLEEFRKELIRIDKSLSEMEIRKMLSGELDGKNCYLT